MPTPIREYRGKDVEMLIAASTIIESAIANKTFLISKRATWADPFLDNIKGEIDTIIQKNLGIDSAKSLRQSTQALIGIEKKALFDIAQFKIQFFEDFKADKPLRSEILNQLGFTTYLKPAQDGDQEALISLLFQFNINMTPALAADIASRGTDPALITTISAYADTLKNADISQETFKQSRKTVTADTLAQYNAIYSKVISIAKISAKLFLGQPDKQAQFSYSNILKAMNQTKDVAKKPK